MNMLCSFFGHRRDTHRAWHDGLDWRSTCKRCHAPLIKDHRDAQWRPFDMQRDANAGRSAKPSAHAD